MVKMDPVNETVYEIQIYSSGKLSQADGHE